MMTEQKTMPTDPAIRFKDVSKRFKINADQSDSVLDTIISSFSRSKQGEDHYLWAVGETTFDILPGECVGLVGRNGSGKSTMLKLAAGIIRPTTGRVEIRGRLSALLELGAGFHPELTGRENISLNASILGLNNAEIAQKYDDIVKFSELGEFVNMPVKHYSSGMYMRLGFSVAVHVNPDVLLIDEILAVGDQSFQDKCIKRLHNLRDEGTTVVFVSHNLETVRSLCSRIMWIDSGRSIADGPSDEVLPQYVESFTSQDVEAERATVLPQRWGSGQIEFTNLQLLNGVGEVQEQFVSGDSVTVEMHIQAKQPVRSPEFSLSFYRDNTTNITDPESCLRMTESKIASGPSIIRCHIERLTLPPADYYISADIHNVENDRVYDHHEKAYLLKVLPDPERGGKGHLDLPAKWESVAQESPAATKGEGVSSQQPGQIEESLI
jgi:lipopolysaccharide transport system ATP-binding protein